MGTPPLSYAKALALVAATVVLSALLVPLIGAGAIDLLFLLPVMAAATLYGLRPGLAAGIAASLAFNFFFLPPLYTFTIADPANVVTAAVLLGVAIAASQLAGRVRAQADLAASSARQNAALAGFSRALTGGTDLAELASAIAAEMARLFDARVTLWTGEGGLKLIAANPPEDRLGEVERAAAQWVLDRGLPAGRGSATLPAADWLFHPLKTSSGVVAVLGLARDDGRDPVRADQLPLLLGLLDQSALAVERLRLTDEMTEVSRLKDRDRLRAALLSSVSHDLRTPLTAVIAATAELRGQMAPGADTAAIDTLDTETQRLARFVANLLDMARVEAGALRLRVEPVDLTDAISSAVHDLRRSLDGHHIDLDVPPDLPLVRVDPQLFHHILINLLDNAGKYSDPGATISIRGRRAPDLLTLEILDTGPGLPPGREAQVFETFARLEGSDRSAGGTGLGLAIVKGFADAMGIGVGASNRGAPHGAVFALRFPAGLLVRTGDLAAHA
jgi:two-component system sensor histidine kinase KdpD